MGKYSTLAGSQSNFHAQFISIYNFHKIGTNKIDLYIQLMCPTSTGRDVSTTICGGSECWSVGRHARSSQALDLENAAGRMILTASRVSVRPEIHWHRSGCDEKNVVVWAAPHWEQNQRRWHFVLVHYLSRSMGDNKNENFIIESARVATRLRRFYLLWINFDYSRSII